MLQQIKLGILIHDTLLRIRSWLTTRRFCGIEATSESSPGLNSTARFNVANGHAARACATKREADRAYARGFWGNVRSELYSRVDHRSLNTMMVLSHIQRYQHDDERRVYPLCSIKKRGKSPGSANPRGRSRESET